MSNTQETKEQIKYRLLKQYKTFRNFSLKIAILFGSITFAGNFCIIALSREPAALQLEDAFLQSALSAIAFSVLGYCVGSLVGTVMQRKTFRRIEEIKNTRKKSMQDQISIRESRLDAISQGSRAVY
jgi:ABC-type dipeptide/oligopeptide/nickel transport system permease component